MNYKNKTTFELLEIKQDTEDKIESLYKDLSLMPKKTFLGVMYLKAAIKRQTKELNNITLELNSRSTTE